MFRYLFCLRNKNIEEASGASKIFPILSRFVVIWALTASKFINIETSLDGFRFYRLIGIEVFLFLLTGTLNVFSDLIKNPSLNMYLFSLRQQIFIFCKKSVVSDRFLRSKSFKVELKVSFFGTLTAMY